MSKRVSLVRFGWRPAVMVATCLAFGAVPAAAGPALGVWTPTGAMGTGRVAHTATLLPHGAVLVTGGAISDNPVTFTATSEIYEPGSRSWRAAAPMSVVRIHHTATLLPNGKVLVVGGDADAGFGIGPVYSSAELYDPLTNSWSPAASMSTPRTLHTATLLANGKVLVAGGEDFTVGIKASAELYDPATNTWSSAGTMHDARAIHTATLLPNGEVLVAGGAAALSDVTTSAELYDPVTNSWTQTGDLNVGRRFQSATLLKDGRVLVAGGTDANGTATNSTEIYDPAAGTWSVGAPMADARAAHVAVRLTNGSVLAAGGFGGPQGQDRIGAEIYLPAVDAWRHAAPMRSPREAATGTLLNNGDVLVAGGAAPGAILAAAELFRFDHHD